MSGEPEKLEIADELIAERRGDPSGELPWAFCVLVDHTSICVNVF